jgi:hypothetical protein
VKNMGNPTIRLYINSGTESTPIWTEVTSSKTIYYAGPDTTSSVLDPVTAPLSGTKWAEELWIGDYPYANGVQCGTFVAPDSATQYAKVLKFTFDTYGTSTAPILTSYKSSSDRTTLTDEIFAGTPETSNTAWQKAIATGTESSPSVPPQNWATATTQTSGSANPNSLKGDLSYVTHPVTPNAGDNILFAIACVVPSDAQAGTSGHTGVLTLKYTYV